MSNIVSITQDQTMTSREIADLVESRHDVVKLSIERLAKSGVISQPPTVDGPKAANGVVEKLYQVGKRDSYIVVAQLCPEFTARLVDRWQELENQAAKPVILSSAEMFLQSAQLMVQFEARTTALEKTQAAIAVRLEEIAESSLWTVCPQNAEPITAIRRRINKSFGLSSNIVDEAIRQVPYSIKPAGMVLNDNEHAQGSHYAVYWVKDVTALFKRFIAECQRETSAFVSHPFIASRFKLANGLESKQ